MPRSTASLPCRPRSATFFQCRESTDAVQAEADDDGARIGDLLDDGVELFLKNRFACVVES